MGGEPSVKRESFLRLWLNEAEIALAWSLLADLRSGQIGSSELVDLVDGVWRAEGHGGEMEISGLKMIVLMMDPYMDLIDWQKREKEKKIFSLFSFSFHYFVFDDHITVFIS